MSDADGGDADVVAEVFASVREGSLDLDEAEVRLRESVGRVPTGDAADRSGGPAGDRLDAVLDAESVLDHYPLPAFVLGADHTVIGYNDGLGDLLGIGPQEALGEDSREILGSIAYPESERERTLADMVVEAPRRADEEFGVRHVDEAAIGGQHVYRDSSTIRNVRGEEIEIDFLACPFFDGDGEVTAVLEVVKERDPVLEEFPGLAGVLSHDIRNPLGVLRQYTRLAADDLDPDHYERMERNLDRIEHIIEDVLALSGSVDADTDAEPVDLSHVAREAWDCVETDAATLSAETVEIEADRTQLREILENLFRNAVDHGLSDGSAGAADEEVAVTVEATDGGFAVTDDGRGIPPEDRERVFEHGYSTTSEGTGFGLPIVHTLAENHGWDVAVTEGASGGARFEFTTQ